VQPILNELPETLDETYGRILQEIPKSNRLHARRLLQCLTVAIRPLRVEELAEVLAVDFGATGGIPKLNEDLRWEDQEQAVLFACSSLIAVVEDDSSRVVQFSHFSVKEFLTSDRLATSTIDASHYHHILLGPSHTIMAQACLSVLLRLDSHINKDSLKDFPLARYASQHLGDHAEFGNVLAHIRGGINSLLDSEKPHFAAWLWVRKGDFDEPPKRPEATPLYHVSGFGFRAMVDYLISKRPEDVTVRGHYGTPLHAALYGGYTDVALLLLGHCVDVDVRGINDRTPLHMAVDHGLLEVTRILIERGASINARDSSDRTPLHPIFLDRSGTFDDIYFDVMRYLLDHGADVGAEANTKHSTTLHLASYYGGFKVARLLLNRGVNINVRDGKCQTPLHKALTDLTNSGSVSDSFVDAVRFLLDHGADLEAEDNNHSTPLHVISKHGNAKAAQLLLEHGARVGALDNDHSTPLHVASRHDNVEAARLLLEHGARVDALDNDHLTPLHVASRRDNVAAAQLLLEHGARVDALDNDHSTPLHFASKHGNPETARLLLEHGADVHALDDNHSTPLHFASKDGNAEAVRLLLEHGADVHALDDNHSTPLHFASKDGNAETVRLLLEHGADVHALDNNHATPLHFLSQHGDDGTARVMLEHHGAIVDARDDEDSTPLHVASECGNAKVARLLLEHGANIHVRNKKDQTPQHLLSTTWSDKTLDDDIDTIRFFLGHGVDVDAVDNNHSTLLHRASYNGAVEVVQLLLECGANINARNKEGHTPLHRVLVELGDGARTSFFDTIQLLLDHGADVDALDDAQSTPLHVASKYGSAKATRLLLERGAKVHLQDNEGHTPSQVASAEGHEKIARLLEQSEQNM